MKKISLIFLIMLMLCSSIVYASNNYAYIFGFDYGDGVNTTAIADQQRMYLANMGYTAYCNTDVDANFAIENSPNTNKPRINSAVFVTNGHSGPGSYQFYGNSSTYLTAKKSGGKYYKFEDIDMSDCKAALFYGCKTNSDARKSTYGVLTDQAFSNGATCSFGWNKSVATSTATDFRERMFYFLRKGYSVDNSAHNAKSEMPWFDETRDYEVVGDGSIKLYNTALTAKQIDSDRLNLIDINNAYNLIRNKNYKLMFNEDEADVYVRYINGIPTSEFIEINKNKKQAHISKVQIDEGQASKLNTKLLNKKANIDKPNTIISRNTKFNATKEENDLTLYCSYEGETKLVRIIKTEYVSNNGDVNYLNVHCFDVENGKELSYSKIVEFNK